MHQEERGAQRRAFTAEYKLRIVHEAAKCVRRGEVEALLRREGLYTSHLAKWKAIVERASLEALRAKRPGGRATSATSENDALRRIVLMQGRILRRVIASADVYGLDEDLAALRAAAKALGLSDVVGPGS